MKGKGHVMACLLENVDSDEAARVIAREGSFLAIAGPSVVRTAAENSTRQESLTFTGSLRNLLSRVTLPAQEMHCPGRCRASCRCGKCRDAEDPDRSHERDEGTGTALVTPGTGLELDPYLEEETQWRDIDELELSIL